MRRVLGIDTAGSVLAVGAWSDDGILVDVAGREPLEHSRRLVVAVAEVLDQAGWNPADVDLIAVSRGPGSYTGLRLGAMVAKTLGWAVGARLVGVDGLAVLAANAATAAAAVVAALPARRGRIYARAYRLEGDPVIPEPLGPVEEGSVQEILPRALEAAAATGAEPLVLGEGVRTAEAAGVPAAPPALDIPRGSVVARLGRWTARQRGTVDALSFVPWYAGLEVASPARGGWGIGTAR